MSMGKRKKKPVEIEGPPMDERLRRTLWQLDNPEPDADYGPAEGELEDTPPLSQEQQSMERHRRALARVCALTKRFPEKWRGYAQNFVKEMADSGASDESIALGLVERLHAVDIFTSPDSKRGRDKEAKRLWVARAVDLLLGGSTGGPDRWEIRDMAEAVISAVESANKGDLVNDARFSELALYRWSGAKSSDPPSFDVVKRAIRREINKRSAPRPYSEFEQVN